MTTSQQIPQRGTKDFTKYAISVMMAYDRGDAIECSKRGANKYDPLTSPAWCWVDLDYRIKPKPTVIPWTAKTCPVGAIVKRNVDGHRSLIQCADTRSAVIGGSHAALTYDTLLSVFTMDDGSPCGTVQ